MWQNILSHNKVLVVLTDIGAILVAHWVAYLLRFDFSIPVSQIQHMLVVIPFLVPIKLLAFYVFGLYRGMWRYTGLKDLVRIFEANLFAQLALVAVLLFLTRFSGLSRSIFILDGVLSFLFCIGLRTAIRLYFSVQEDGFTAKMSLFSLGNGCKKGGIKTLVIGAGQAGEALLREIIHNKRLNYQPIGLIDDDPTKKGRSIHGVPVLGILKNMKSIVSQHKVQELLIAMPSATGKQMRRVMECCGACGVSYKTLPSLGEIIDGKVTVKALRDVSYEDLLGRSQVELDNPAIAEHLTGKTILITGAGGSIGSELCRQVVKFDPARLILVDSNELNIFSIDAELKNEIGFKKQIVILGRVQDSDLMNRAFSLYRPEVVFHAAAYKHVPLVENNPWEGVFNNIQGSLVTMKSAAQHGVKRFVLVSTDKAVRPTNVMGACKRVTELIMQSLSNGNTKFMAVRFGNVVGSSGSVIPFFRRQIEKGGPVTVTHPEATRYFMTIPEASRLILQASSMGLGGEIFVLQMGTPVKIADMAEDLIRLSGKEPHRDIEIKFTGLRDGEKLYEELITSGEGISKTWHNKIMVLEAEGLCHGLTSQESAQAWLQTRIDKLRQVALTHDAAAIKKSLKELVPEYQAQNNDSVFEQLKPSAPPP